MRRNTDNKAKIQATSPSLGNTDLTFYTLSSRDVGPPTTNKDIYRSRPEDVGSPTRNKDIFRTSAKSVGFPTINKDICRSRPEDEGSPTRNKDIFGMRAKSVGAPTRNKDIYRPRHEDVGSPTSNEDIFRLPAKSVGASTINKDIYRPRPKNVGFPTRNKDIFRSRAEDVVHPLETAAIESSEYGFSDGVRPDISSDYHYFRHENSANLALTWERKSSGFLEPNFNGRPDSYDVFKKPVAPLPLAGIPKTALQLLSEVPEVILNENQKKLLQGKKIHSLVRLSDKSDCVYPSTSALIKSPVQQQNSETRVMNCWKKSLSGSLQHKKDHIPECRKQYQWQANATAVRVETCSFSVEYLGCVEVVESMAIRVCEEALRVLKNSRRMIISTLYVTGGGLQVIDVDTEGILLDLPIKKVFFCAPDRNDERGFSLIAQDEIRRLMCHVFLSMTDPGEQLSYAVGYAFGFRLERIKIRDDCDLQNTASCQTVSFSQTSSTESAGSRLQNVQYHQSSDEGCHWATLMPRPERTVSTATPSSCMVSALEEQCSSWRKSARTDYIRKREEIYRGPPEEQRQRLKAVSMEYRRTRQKVRMYLYKQKKKENKGRQRRI